MGPPAPYSKAALKLAPRHYSSDTRGHEDLISPREAVADVQMTNMHPPTQQAFSAINLTCAKSHGDNASLDNSSSIRQFEQSETESYLTS